MKIPSKRPPAITVERRRRAQELLGHQTLSEAPNEAIRELANSDPAALVLAIRSRNQAIVQQGLYELTQQMPPFVCWHVAKKLDDWWSAARDLLEYQEGTYGELVRFGLRELPPKEATWDEVVEGLELLGGLYLINRLWKDIFSDQFPKEYLSDVRDLIAARNTLAHQNRNGIPAKNIFDTVIRVMRPIHFKWAEELQALTCSPTCPRS